MSRFTVIGTGARAHAGASRLAFLGAFCALGASPASAAETGGEQAGAGLDDIVVTARRVDENLQNVPVAITAYSGVDLERRNALTVADVAAGTPSLAFQAGPATPSAVQITLRGQVQEDILASSDPSVGVYVDGLYWARAYGINQDLLDVRSVQVLKGPQGTLFGRNTTGGALLFETNDPDTSRMSGSASASYGRFNEFVGRGILNVPFGDKAAARIAIQRSSRDGYALNLLDGKKYNNRSNWSGRAKLLLEPGEGTRIVLSAEYFDMNQKGPLHKLLIAPNPYSAATAPVVNDVGVFGFYYAGVLSGANPFDFPAAIGAGIGSLGSIAAADAKDPDIYSNDFPGFTKVRTHTYGLTASRETEYGEIKLVGGYRDIRQSSELDDDGTPLDILSPHFDQDLDQYSGELQTTGSALDDRLQFAAGAYYFHEAGTDFSTTTSLNVINPITARTRGRIDSDSVGVYGQGTYKFSPLFSFTGGLRWSRDIKRLTIFSSNLDRATNTATCVITSAPAPGCELHRSDSFSGVSYTAGFEYTPSKDMLLYLKTSKGFRSGGQNLRAVDQAYFLPFRPETAFTQELGLKTEFLDRRVRLNLAAYYSRVSDIQRQSFFTIPGTTTLTTIIQNAGKTRIWGLEGELTAKLTPELQARLSGSLTKPKYLEYIDFTGNDVRSSRFVAVPKYTAGAAIDYTRPIGQSAKLTMTTDISWQSRVALSPYNDPANPQNDAVYLATSTAPSAIVNTRLSVSFADDRYELAVFGRNLTDNRAITSSILITSLNVAAGYRREPATYGLSGTVRF